MNEEDEGFSEWFSNLAKKATHDAYKKAILTKEGAVIVKGTDIIRVTKKNGKIKTEIVKSGLEPNIKVPTGTTFKIVND